MRLALAAALLLLVLSPTASAQDPDPDEITPLGYEFCGWRDFVNGGWALAWSEDLSGAYLVAFADGLSCTAARRNVLRVLSRRRPMLTGYRCKALRSAHEFADVRCASVRGSRRFRYQTGA